MAPMGIILFYMLCGHLPFKGNKETVLADKIVNDDLEFDEEEWETRSKKVRDLITSCLVKDPEERITIEGFVAHPWFKNNLNQNLHDNYILNIINYNKFYYLFINFFNY